MTTVTIEAGTLTASLADRVVSGLLLPYNEVGRTNLGRFSIPPGVIDVPADASVLVLNDDHDRRVPLGHGLTLTATDAGQVATFRVGATPEGDAYLAEVADPKGRRRSFSAEVADVVIREGKAVAGRLFAAAVCARGAFPSATLLASDVGELPPGVPDYMAPSDSTSTTTEEIVIDGVTYVRETESRYVSTLTKKGDEAPPDPNQEAAPVTTPDPTSGDLAASALAAAPPSGAPIPAALTTPRAGHAARDMYASLASGFASGNPRDMYAALDQITQTDVFDVINQPQFVGELWNGVTYVPRFLPLLNSAELTSSKVTGWQFVEGKKPQVGDYAGGGVEVPTNEVDTEAVEVSAARLAAGWNVDRIHRDFPNPSFWDAFFRAANEDYARKMDAKVRTHFATAANFTATTVVADAWTPLAISEAAYKIVKAGLALTNSDRGAPQWAILSEDLYEEIAFTRVDDSLAYITAAFGLDKSSGFSVGQIVSDTTLAAGTVKVGIKGAGTVHQLGGASPLRVSAEDVAKGNLLEALFGYYAIIRHDKGAVVQVTTAP